MIDLYHLLNIGKQASKEQVRQAFRRKAKRSHPDAGGNAEEFAALCKAHDILTDPRRRLNYDSTGNTDDVAPNNEYTAAVQIIAEVLEQILATTKTPEQMDIVAVLKQHMQGGLTDIHKQLTNFKKEAERFEGLAARFKRKTGNNFIKNILDKKASICRANIIGGEAKMAQVELALKLLQEFSFDFDQHQVIWRDNTF